MFTADERRILTEAQDLLLESVPTISVPAGYMEGYRVGRLQSEMSAARVNLHMVLFWAEQLDNALATA